MHATFQTLLTQPLLKRLPDRLIQGLALGAAAAWLATASAVAAFETSARAAFVLDQTTGTILLDK
ncbi:MAG: D-alanyl-D-alanine carboxypeptidase, partial [Pikeienuella sp.]